LIYASQPLLLMFALCLVTFGTVIINNTDIIISTIIISMNRGENPSYISRV
jgi:hypothetical protein